MIRPRKPARPTRRARLRPTLDRLEGRALMAYAGGLDPSFGGGLGYYVGNINTGLGQTARPIPSPTSVAIEPDGSVVVAFPASGPNGTTFGVTHLLANGTLDAAFGTNGVALVALPAGDVAGGGPSSFLAQADGKIVLVGAGVAARLNLDGSPDTTFGTNGVEALNQATLGVTSPSFPYAALQTNGDLVLAGASVGPQGVNPVTVARLTPSGTPDPTFGTNGVAILADSSVGEVTDGVAVQPNGQVVVLANIPVTTVGQPPSSTPVLIRLNAADGSRDSTLGQAGIISSGVAFPVAKGLIAAPNGQLLVLGRTLDILGNPNLSNGVAALARVNPDGSLDNSVPLAINDKAIVTAFALQPDGKIVVTGTGITPSTDAQGIFAAVRLTASLTPDPTYGLGGLSTVPIPTGANAAFIPQALAVGSNDQVILVGSNPQLTKAQTTVPPTNIAVARLTATGSAHPGDYNGDGIADPAIYLPLSGSFAIKTSGGGPGETVQLGIPGPGNTIPIPGDYYGTGQEDLAVYLVSTGTFAIKDPTGKTPGEEVQLGSPGLGQSIPVPGDFYGTGRDDLAVYLVSTGTFAIKDPTGATPGKEVQLGTPGAGLSIPVPGDYYGTGQADLAVYLAQPGVWAIKDPSGKTPGVQIQFGAPGLGNSIPVPGDYDGSGRTELAVYLPDSGKLIYRPAAGGPDVSIPYGTAGAGNSLPAPGDYTGSGRAEVAVYLPNAGIFAYRPASGGKDVYIQYGPTGEGQSIPVTAVVLSPFPGTLRRPGGSAQVLGILGEPDTLDFLPTTTAKKAKDGGQSA